MEKGIRNISFNIYADSDGEAERGRKAICQFIDIMDQHDAKVSGNRLEAALKKLFESPFITSEIIKFFKKQ